MATPKKSALPSKKPTLSAKFPATFFVSDHTIDGGYSIDELPRLHKEAIDKTDLEDDGDSEDIVEYQAVRVIRVRLQTHRVVEESTL